jgi:CDP-diglyceride synthetase
MREFWQVSYLFAPVLLGLTAHGVCIRFGWLQFLYKPVDAGNELRGRRIFGANKTWRGIVAMALGTASGFVIQAVWLHNYESVRQLELFDYSVPRALIIGSLVGVAVALSELPNSFIKRQMDIAPGGTTSGGANTLFYVLDQVDFLVGAWIVLSFVIGFSWLRVLYSFIFLFVTHQVISFLGYLLGMRKTAR